MSRKLIDIMGQKFGRLTVIRRVNSVNDSTLYLCKCKCGTEKIINGAHLRRGYTKSCGCLNKENVENKKLFTGLASMRALIRRYKMQAKRRGYSFNLKDEQFAEITQKDCFYCGAKPNNISKGDRCNGIYVYNGIDRINSKKGYTLDNIVPCCRICNRAKSDLTFKEFKEWIEKVYKKTFNEVNK